MYKDGQLLRLVQSRFEVTEVVFSSLLFLFRFLPIVLLIYYITPKKYRNGVLFFASLIFYAWGEPIYVLIMLFSTAVDYVHGRLVYYYIQKGNRAAAKRSVISSVCINLALLIFFKYTDFMIQNVNLLLGSDISILQLTLPIGISFYTFQTMSYTIDVFRGEANVQPNIISFGAYVALFPQLIAGPIVQYKTIAEQLNDRKENLDDFSKGAYRFIIGLGKKVLLANNIGLLWDEIQKLPVGELPVITAWIGALAFTFQIYFDFSGYSDMAIGLGNMFGFQFLENFRYPYQADSITDFWRRWHISLGTWFRDYVYIPLGGNRYGIKRQIRNIAIVWLLTGIWHGASWNFVVWGVYFGVILVIEKMWILPRAEKIPAIIRHTYTMFLVIISWVIFAFDNFGHGLNYIKAMFGGNQVGVLNQLTLYYLMNYGFLLVILILASTCHPFELWRKLREKCNRILIAQSGLIVMEQIWAVVLFLVTIAYLVDDTYNPFLYFRF